MSCCPHPIAPGRRGYPAPRVSRRVSRRLAGVLLVVLGLTGLCLGEPAAATAEPPVGGPELAATTTVVNVPPGVPQPPRLPAQGYLLADLTTGEVLVAHDAHRRMLTASTMKVLTALTLLPRLDPRLVYTATQADAAVDGSKVGVVPGSTYPVQKLFLGMMLSSGNDAANALANAAGGVPATVAMMQQQAGALGALDTTVRDPSGLDAPGQRSSAYDLALITRAAMQRPDFRSLVSTKTATFPGRGRNPNRTKGFQIQNHNDLLSHYRGAIGVKTGYTEAAKWTYIGAARRAGHTYVVTELGLSRAGWVPASTMLDWAFAHGSQATPVGRLVAAGEVTGPSPAPAASHSPGSPANALAAGVAPVSTDGAMRWVGVAGLAGAGAIVAGLALGTVRRRARR